LNEPEKSDEELLGLIAVDDWPAFHQLYQRYRGRVHAFYRRRIASDIAEDLVQRCFMRIYEKAQAFNDSYPASVWIFSLARNLLIDEYRKGASENRLLQQYRDESEFANQNEFEGDQLWQIFQEHFEELDEKQKNVLNWRYQEGFSFAEIAQRLQVSEANARQLVSRAVRNLRQRIHHES